MALTQEQVDWWFSQNPNATAEDVAAAVKAAGGLNANQGLASMIANRYAIAEPEVTNYYNAYTAPKAETPAEAIARIAQEQAEAKRIADANLAALQTTGATSGITSTPVNDSGLGKNTQTFTDSIVNAPTSTTDFLSTIADTTSANTTVTGGAGTTQTQAVTDPYAAINQAWNNGDYAATNAIIASAGLSAADIKSHYNLDDATMNWVLGQGIKTVDKAATGSTSVTGSTGTDTVAGVTGNTTQGDLLATLAAPADNINSTNGYTKSATAATSGGVSNVIEGDDIATQIAQLPQEYASWSRSADQKYMELIRKSDGAVLDRRTVGDFSDLDLAKIGLSFIPGAGQILAAVNIADAVRSGNILQAAIGATGLMPGMANVNTALRVGQAVDSGNTFGALTALAGNTDLQNLTGFNTANVGGFTAKDAMAAGNLVQAATTGNYGGVISNLGTLTGSSDTALAGRALSILTRFQNGDTKALGDAIALSTGISNSTTKTTGTTGSTTVGDFEDTEVTRLKGLGYTKEQIQEYFRNLDNLTSNLDTAASTVVGATGNDVTLPTGVQLASTGDGVFRTDVGGVPTYAESANASSVTAPLGYKLLSTSEVENKPAGSYYDITANAWFKPDTAVTDLTGGDTIQADAALFNNSLGTLDQLDSNRTADDFADFLRTIGITNVTQLTDSGLSNQDILDMINALDDTVTVTGATGNDTLTGATTNDTITGAKGNDNLETVTVTGAKGNDTITGGTTNDVVDTVTVTGAKGNDTLTGGTGNDKPTTLQCPAGFEPNADNTQCIPVVNVVDKRCGPGKVYDEDLKFCVDIQPAGCAPGFHDDGTGFCIPDDDTKPLDCPEGYEPNEAGTACIPVVDIVDKRCDPGFVYDEDLKQCVAIDEEPCDEGYHRVNGVCVQDECPDGYVRNLATGACEKPLDCPEGYEPNDAGTACIPVVTVVDKKCDPGFVYDEEQKKCVPIEEEPCDAGYHRENGVCVPDECPEGYVRNLATGVCEKPLDCPEGYEPNEAGTECIPVVKILDKKCDPGFVYDEEQKKCVPITEEPCDAGYHRENGVCVQDECEEGYVRNLATGVCEKPLDCPKGYEPNEAGTECIPIIEIKSCPTGFVRDEATGKCVPITDTPCDEGYHLENGICVPDDDPCDEGYHRENGVCVQDECAEGYIRNLETGLCEKVETKECPIGQVRNAAGKCVPITSSCPAGQVKDATGKCVPITIQCPTGFKLVNGACVPITTTTPTYTTGASGAEGEKTDPIYAGGMDDFNLLATLQELLASEAPKKDNKKLKDKTKMASGGHLDDLLAEQMTVDDLLKLLR
jgi:hypothetical protein